MENNCKESNQHNELEYTAILACFILTLYIFASHIIERKKIHFLHESAISIVFGLLCAFILDQVANVAIHFNEQLFFTVILPPIIFSAGYTLRKKYFIQNFGLIQFYGIIGTVIAFFVISSFAILLNEWGLLGVKLHLSELLMLSSVLCATDTVAVLNIVKEHEYPLLNSILFGEGIMNDAISIVIFRAIQKYVSVGKDDQFQAQTLFIIAGDFLYLLFMSVLIGLLFGLAISYFFKKFDSYNQYPIRETALIYLISYVTYLLSEIFGFSGIISLFVCGIIMGQYTYQNISHESQKGTVLVFESIAYIAEAFVFCYLGMSVYQMKDTKEEIPYMFSFLILVVIMLARFFAIFTLPCIKFLFRREQALSIKELKIVWYSGLIRGAIAFAMVLQIKSQNSTILNHIVMVVVVFTIVVLSSMLQVFSKYVGLKGSEEEEMIKQMVITENQGQDISSFGDIGKYEGQGSSSGKIKQRLTNFEEKYVRPVFIKEQNTQIKEINLADFSQLGTNSSNRRYSQNNDEL